MPSEPYTSLRDAQRVFRIVERGGGHWPRGHQEPNPSFMVPTKADKEEAARIGRVPGTSVWDVDETTVGQALAIREHDRLERSDGATRPAEDDTPPHEPWAFAIGVAAARRIGAQHGREVDVVTDPRADLTLPGAHGHALIEGLARPAGQSRQAQTALLKDLVEAMSRHD